MRVLAFILAVFSAGYSMFQSGLGLMIVEKGFDFGWIANLGALEIGTQCILVSAVLGILGAFFAVSKAKIVSWTLILAMILMIYVEIAAPFTNSWLCVLLYALAAMWGSSGFAKAEAEEEAVVESAPETVVAVEEVLAAEPAPEELIAEEALVAKSAPEAAAEDAVAQSPVIDEALVASEEVSEETCEETSCESALAEAEEAAEEAAGPKTVVVKQEESPLSTVLVMIVAVVIGAGMMSAYWKNDAEQKAKAVRSADPVYQQMTEDVKAKDALILKHEAALKENELKLQEQQKLVAEKEQQIQGLAQHSSELDSQIAGLKTALDGAKVEAETLKEKVAALEKSIAEEAAKKYAFVRGTNVRVRSNPSTAKDSQVVARITNVTVEVLKSERPRGSSAAWYYVKGDFGTGWVFGKNIEMQR